MMTTTQKRAMFGEVEAIKATLTAARQAAGGYESPAGWVKIESDGCHTTTAPKGAAPVVLVRQSCWSGPCLELGALLGESPKFIAYRDDQGRTRRIAKQARRSSGFGNPHLQACARCEDHPRTSYPEGRMD